MRRSRRLVLVAGGVLAVGTIGVIGVTGANTSGSADLAGGTATGPTSTLAPPPASAAPRPTLDAPVTSGVYGAPTTGPVQTSVPTGVASDEARPSAEPTGLPVVVTYASFDRTAALVQASAYVGGVVEDGGSCTLTVSSGTERRTATVSASADATTTTCGDMAVAWPSVPSGDWTATVAYSSATGIGTSDPAAVAVDR